MSCGFLGGDSYYQVPEDFRSKDAVKRGDQNEGESHDDASSDTSSDRGSASTSLSIRSKFSADLEDEQNDAVEQTSFWMALFKILLPILFVIFITDQVHTSSIIFNDFRSHSINGSNPVRPGLSLNATDLAQIPRTYTQLWDGWLDHGSVHDDIAFSYLQSLRPIQFFSRFHSPLQKEVCNALKEMHTISIAIRPVNSYRFLQKDILTDVIAVTGDLRDMIQQLEKIQSYHHVQEGFIESFNVFKWLGLRLAMIQQEDHIVQSVGPYLKPDIEKYKDLYINTFKTLRNRIWKLEERSYNTIKNFTRLQAAIEVAYEPLRISHAWVQFQCKWRIEYTENYSLPGFGLIKTLVYWYFYIVPGDEYCLPDEQTSLNTGFRGLESFNNNTLLALKYLEQTGLTLRSIEDHIEILLLKLSYPSRGGTLHLESELWEQIESLKEAYEELNASTVAATNWSWGSMERYRSTLLPVIKKPAKG